jgi:hypothetical protein
MDGGFSQRKKRLPRSYANSSVVGFPSAKKTAKVICKLVTQYHYIQFCACWLILKGALKYELVIYVLRKGVSDTDSVFQDIK